MHGHANKNENYEGNFCWFLRNQIACQILKIILNSFYADCTVIMSLPSSICYGSTFEAHLFKGEIKLVRQHCPFLIVCTLAGFIHFLIYKKGNQSQRAMMFVKMAQENLALVEVKIDVLKNIRWKLMCFRRPESTVLFQQRSIFIFRIFLWFRCRCFHYFLPINKLFRTMFSKLQQQQHCIYSTLNYAS